ncbi:MAG: TIM barrel protein [Candidatus Omnitrophica bacterium]|nr:TIM barrel protein [Candidatus Omnitrophota bacterium]
MIRLGPAGSGGLGNTKGLEEVKKLGLNAMEVEFTYGVRMPIAEAKKIGVLAKTLDIALSVHAPYYINLASFDKEKVGASKKRIIDSSERAHYLGAKYIVFHAGFYQEREKEEIFKIIKKEIIDVQKTIKKNNWKVNLAPETTGKKTQFGDLDEVLRLHKETGCEFCVDFAHLLARDGNISYDKVFDKLKGIKYVHAHFSGIEFTEKGEKRHQKTRKNDIIPLVKFILKRKTDITIINESPDPIRDSLETKKIINSLRKL